MSAALISTVVLIGILAAVYAESGLLIGMFLAGDSLPLIAGLLVAQGSYLRQPLWLVCLLVSGAAIAGDQFGYSFGRRFGSALSRRPSTRLFKQHRLTRAQDLFTKYGGRTIGPARFVPIVRTFTPVVAGAGHLPYRSFLTRNIAGATLWACGVTVLGDRLAQLAVVRSHLGLVVAGLVLASLAPAGIGLLRDRRADRDRVSRRR